MSNRILFLLVFCGLVASASAQSNFNRFNFTAGGGAGIGRGDVASFVGESYQGVVGGGINLNRWFGVDAEYMYYNLSFRPSVMNNQGLADASGHLQSVSLDGIVTPPYHLGKWGTYGIFGVGFYDRSVSRPNYPLATGAPCQPAWIWFNIYCFNGAVTTPGQVLGSYSKVAGGYNFGGGITRRLDHFHNAKLFAEFRYHKAYQSDVQTIVWPITVGVRW
ncbi:MAG: outer membrane beta-barrel protein [Terriglobales bacterium]